jgi:hypothetical protein
LLSSGQWQLDWMVETAEHSVETIRPIHPTNLSYGRACHPSVWDGQIRVGLGTVGYTRPLI